ncbi:uncharacterized protein OGAPODRAFT_16706 [Ogataea polymorpha]|uniref:uncharacterized protein n=1 Tax=Ogataea polymorpha TaxID=460523 RepID=UPI0007F38341|nr:uncharacterized protein OGAPODRAFT_16706 [Ogataea polymorpha]KAG7913632.1 hypothetical protein KL927_005218 [Ogataea polymorpha]KAG7930115.1 hypothetical protein KL934_005227 [Ogataea polymorpha]OBA16111.1 hypothetical protein OGAPODRAFT_16706 [Ogataea polymorpha]
MTTTTITTLRLESRFKELKREIIRPENHEAVQASWGRLLKALDRKADEISRAGSSYIPEVNWGDIENGGFTEEMTSLIHARGCLIIRDVIDDEQCNQWREDTKKYIESHPGITGTPRTGVTSNWFIHWSKAQVEARSHPRMVQLMKAVGKLYKNNDPDALLDMDSQVVYADRLRIRYPGRDSTLPLHLDSSSIERWEDEQYRDVYREIFEGRWEDWDPNLIDRRPSANQDLYQGMSSNGSTCSVFRSFQGWLALSDAKPGEGTIWFLPDLKCVLAYILLRPFFDERGNLDLSSAQFPGATPGSGQFMANDRAMFPHLQHDKSVVGIPYVKPGDFVLWHADLLHEVDEEHKGDKESSVVYIAHTPLCPYNIETLKDSRECFESGAKPRDFRYEYDDGPDESSYEDRGREEHLLSLEGKQALGLVPFDVNEEGLTPGQIAVRKMANEAMQGYWSTSQSAPVMQKTSQVE